VALIKLEKLILKQNICETVENARELIISNRVLVNGALQNNVNAHFDISVQISLTKPPKKYVSRGGFKLEAALGQFNIEVKNKKVLDVGTSTGGFTDCLLQKGADHVISIDVGRSQLDNKIRNHKDVTVFERLNAKDLTLDITNGPCDFCVIDVSFTSILPLLNAIFSVLTKDGEIIALIKPQFEGKKNQVDESGVIKEPEVHLEILKHFIEEFPDKYILENLIYSPIKGAKGNIEFLAHFVPSYKNAPLGVDFSKIVYDAHNQLKGKDD
jgi:23S rRNA (cytidine1920-2'-O)/16S rRNA (cytidine1409-2'-O)-methyltransferase